MHDDASTECAEPECLAPARRRLYGANHPGARGPDGGDGARRAAKLRGEAIAWADPYEVLVVVMNGESRAAFMGDIIITHLLANGSVSVV